MDDILNMIAEIRNSMPMTLIIIVMLSIIGPSVFSLAVLLALSEFVTIFRTTRAKTKLEKNMDYITAARSNGANDARIIFRYIMPNIINNVTVLATLMIGTIILEEAGGAIFTMEGANLPLNQKSTVLGLNSADLKEKILMG